MRTIVLDANELSRDFLCTGLPYQLLDHMFHSTWVNVCVPAVVFEETVAKYHRDITDMHRRVEQLTRQRRLIGLPPIKLADPEFDYRSYLSQRFDERLGITVLPWPDISHEDLVARAVSRTPPFDEKGSGYRDSLIWADVVRLASFGSDVALVSTDRDFAGKDDRLAPELQAEIDPLPGTVELVRDFRSWLLGELPWGADDLASAVAKSRDQEFYTYLLESDFQSDLLPSVEELGFRWAPYSCRIRESEWDGYFEKVGASDGPDGMTLVEYDLGQTIEFDAEFPEGIEPDPNWDIEPLDFVRSVRASGEIRMLVRVAVLFGGEFGFTVEQLSWRRADGTGPGRTIYRPDQDSNQLHLPGF